MKAIHNTDEKRRIEKFSFGLLGKNTWTNASSLNYAFSGLIGVWFSDHSFDGWNYHHEYEINSENYLELENNEELIDIINGFLIERGFDPYSPQDYDVWDEAETERIINQYRELAEEFREKIGVEVIVLKNDLEFGGKSFIVFNTNCIR